MSYKALKIDGTWETVETGDIKDYVAIATDTYSGSLEDIQDYFIGCGKYTWGNKVYAGYPTLPILQGDDNYKTGWYKFENTSSWSGSWDSTECEDLDYNMYTLAFKRQNSYTSYSDLDLITNINLKKCLLNASIQQTSATVDGVANTPIYRINASETRMYVGSYYLVANKSVPYIQLQQTMPITSEWSLDDWFPADLAINNIDKQSIGLSCDLRNDTTSYKFGEGSVYYISGEERKFPYKTGYRWGASPSAQFTFVPCLNGSKTENLIDSSQTVKYIALDNDVVCRIYYSTPSRTVSLTTDGFKTLESCLLHIAKLGFSFKVDNKYYKPIAENGLITGYTEDLTYQSEWDEWTTTDTIKRPSGGGDESDKYDDIGITLNGAGNSFCHWYGVTSAEMYSLLSAFYSASIPTGMNPMDHIIGVIQAPFDISTNCAGTAASPIKIGTWDTGVTGFMLSNQGDNSFVNLGSYSIPKYHNNFMDYAPYTTISLYVPYCGTVDLPPALFVGHTVSIQLMYDIFAGDCTAMIMRDGSYYTSISGNFTSTVAISAENMGAIKQAIVNGCMGVIGGAVTGIGGFASGNVAVGVGGTAGMLTSFVKSTEEVNSIAPTMRGVAGGRSMFYKPNRPIIYINTPVNKITDGYINTHGLPVMESKTLSAGNGFTVVDNPIVNGNMTQIERSAIIDLFRNGVIL